LAICGKHNLVVSASTAIDTLSHLFPETGEIEKAREVIRYCGVVAILGESDPASTQKVHGLG
jgi:hypothetical protein